MCKLRKSVCSNVFFFFCLLQGILNLGGKNCSPSSPSKSKGKKKCVRFTKEESEIIGYDGGDTDEEEDDVDEDSCTNWSGQEFEESGDDERALERLTRTNTDFNSVLSNLSTKPSCAPPLLLGAKHHHKQTLQVTLSLSFSNSEPSQVITPRFLLDPPFFN